MRSLRATSQWGGSPSTWRGGLFRQQSPWKGRHPASLRVRVQGRAQSLEQERDVQGVGEAPRGSRAQMLGFCFLDILPTTCEGPCVSGHLGILLVFGDQSEKETVSWTP